MSDEARETVQGMLLGEGAEAGSYEISAEAAAAALRKHDVPALAAEVKQRVAEDRLVLPNSDALIERAVVSLLGGNLVLHGPPGTGKTHLARLLASAFDVELDETTGTPEWSTYDVVGGLRPAVGPRGTEVLQPWLGAVTSAAMRCGKTVEESLAETSGAQANWLLIDELSRADIDKAIGPLYTALSGSDIASRHVRLWFERAPERAYVTLPERFRLLATMNDVDTAFVNQLSQGLQRRFKFVFVGVPGRSQTEDELQAIGDQAGRWHGRLYGGVDADGLPAHGEKFRSEERVVTALQELSSLVEFLRWDDDGPRWPLGSAVLAGVLQQLAIRAYGDPGRDDLIEALDFSVADQLIPVASALTEEEFESTAIYLEDTPLVRSAGALEQLRTPFRTVNAD